MDRDKLEKLRREAGEDFAPTSAFGFFEEQYAELREEFGLALGDGAWECDQEPGDVFVVPAGLYRTSRTT